MVQMFCVFSMFLIISGGIYAAVKDIMIIGFSQNHFLILAKAQKSMLHIYSIA